MSIEDTVKDILKQVIDIKPEEIQPDDKLENGLGIDSTEMVEIAVGLKKALNLEIGDNELKKSHSFNEIVEILKSKGVSA